MEKKDKELVEFRIGELFCGPGGIGYASTGLSIENGNYYYQIKHVWATDYDKDSCETYRENVLLDNREAVICKDIRKLEYETLRKISDIDALAFGFPCNDFSIVGKQKGINGVYGPLYEYGVNALKTFKPKWFLAENVGGLRNSNDGDTFGKILNELSEAGYNIVPHLYKFDEYGIPQKRHRIIIIGIREDLDVAFSIPSPEPYTDIDISAKNAIENPPIPEDAFNNELTQQSDTVVKRLKYIKPGENAFTANIPDELRLNIKGAKFSLIYRRLKPDQPSYTVTGSGGGGTHVYHWEEDRALTNRERARLQTFPDDFEFVGSKESVRKQIGMAVPPRGVKIIMEALLKTFADIEYETVDANISME